MTTEERLPPSHDRRSMPIALMAVKSRDYLEPFVLDEGLNPVRAYHLSKEAMILWSDTNAEFPNRRGLGANTLVPGAVTAGIPDDLRLAFGDGSARELRRAGTLAEIAQVAAFALSPESNWLKGTDVAIDGGMEAFALFDNPSLEDIASRGGEAEAPTGVLLNSGGAPWLSSIAPEAASNAASSSIHARIRKLRSKPVSDRDPCPVIRTSSSIRTPMSSARYKPGSIVMTAPGTRG